MTLRMNWAVGIVGSYLVFAAGTLAFVGFALHRPVDFVAADYYAQSLRQDQQMDAERNTRALGVEASIVQPADRAVVVSVPRAHLSSAHGTVTLYRASDASADRAFALQADAAGRQRISLAGLQAGAWSVRVRWTAQGRDFYLEQRVFAR